MGADMYFEKAFERLLGHEGGYSNNPHDPGGETMYGITEKVARAHGYMGSMRKLPLAEAQRISRLEYWNPLKLEQVPEVLHFDLFDACYHSGKAQAIKFLQRAASVKTDGVFGPITAMAVRSMDPYRLAARFNGARLDFLNDRRNWDEFAEGWSQRIAENLLSL